MALTFAKLKFETVWRQTKTVSGFNGPQDVDSLITTVSPTISAGACNRVYRASGTILTATTLTIDLSTLTEPAFGEAISPVRFYSVHVYVTAFAARYMPGAADPLVAPFNDLSDAINLNAGDSFMKGSTTAATISATVKNVRIINTGAGTLTYYIAFLLGV